MDDQIAFLRARLDEQHAALIAYRDHRASEGQCVNVLGDDPADYSEFDSCALHLKTAAATPYRDVDYGLAEIEATRRILAEVEYEIQDAERRETGDGLGLSHTILELLALPYASHPDYQPEWRLDAD